MTTQVKTRWHVKGDALGACNCDYGCPCTFDARPTRGSCEGTYVFRFSEGQIGDVSLGGAIVSVSAHAPGAIHEGNLTILALIDEKTTPQQREVLVPFLGGEYGGVFGIFASLTTKLIGPEYVPVDWKLDGANSYAKLGDVLEMQLTPIKNPVTGVPSSFSVLLGNGLLTDRMELYTTTSYRLKHPELSYEHPDKFGETFTFDWKGEE